jgi:hypothetical protein
MELHVMHSASDKIKNQMDGACSSNGERNIAYKVLVGKIYEKRQRDRHRSRWENNINICFKIEDRVSWNVLVWLRIGTGGE